MDVRMKTIMAGPGGGASIGAIVSVDDATGYAWIEGGFAEQVDFAPPPASEPAAEEIEEAVAPPVERAVSRGRKKG